MNNASVESVYFPTEMFKGEVAQVQVQMRNTGSTVWSPQGQYRLGAWNPMDNNHWGLGRVELTQSLVAPGEIATFNFKLTATRLGDLQCDWRMVQDGVEWFGEAAQGKVNVVAAVSQELIVPWNVNSITGSPYGNIIFNSGVQDTTNGYSHDENWMSPFPYEVYIIASELWIGAAYQAVMDLHMQLNRVSDGCEIQIYQNDRYSNPSLPNNVVREQPHIPLAPNDGVRIACRGQRLVPNPGGYPEIAHYAARLRVDI
jgi:hypothetical protein